MDVAYPTPNELDTDCGRNRLNKYRDCNSTSRNNFQCVFKNTSKISRSYRYQKMYVSIFSPFYIRDPFTAYLLSKYGPSCMMCYCNIKQKHSFSFSFFVLCTVKQRSYISESIIMGEECTPHGWYYYIGCIFVFFYHTLFGTNSNVCGNHS